MITADQAFDIYNKAIESNFGNLIICVENAISEAAKTCRTSAYVFVDFVDLTKSNYVVDVHSYFENLGYTVDIEDYVCHADASRDNKSIVRYESESLVRTLKEQGRCKGGLITIYFG